MRLEISQAISLILALPAHRSANESQRVLGEKAFEILYAYKEFAADEIEKAYNMATISSVLSSVRAFSVERDRIASEWRAIEAIKERRLRLIKVIRNISPFEKGNYWSKLVSFLLALGLTFPAETSNVLGLLSLGALKLILILVALEIISKALEFILANLFERKLPIEREKKWREESLKIYKHIVSCFVDEVISVNKRYYPDESEIYGFRIQEEGDTEKLKSYLLKIHFYL